MSIRVLAALALAMLPLTPALADDWKPADGPLMTRWAAEVGPDNALPEYPRPQMVREKWQNLNGLWDYDIRLKDTKRDGPYDGKILVPFCVESALSGVMKRVGKEYILAYHRTFTVPDDWKGQNVLLHFGAVDWRATVTLNGKELGTHEGGYDPFSFDITDALKDGGEQELFVNVWDPTDAGTQPRGKQVNNPGGIFYTPVTGIWQTVWIEPVPKVHVKSLHTVSYPGDDYEVDINLTLSGREPRTQTKVIITAADGTEVLTTENISEDGFVLKIPKPRLWSPADPYLYGLRITLASGDSVESYFALRTIEVAKDDAGVNRLMLNGAPVFQFGPLDQGWWPDGLYTAPTDAALKYDIEATKKLGFNMCRKHVKTEPARWYYHCDQLGLMVWQDMPNGDRHIAPGAPDITRTAESEAIYKKEWTAIIESLKNHPCIVAWVPFNEGWGQFKTNEYLAYTKKLDPTRPVDGPSGWNDRNGGDMHDMHKYPSPGMFPVEEERASVLGEFGGLGWPVEGHLWKKQNNWGYRTYQSREELTRQYKAIIYQLPPLVERGLAAAIYTQTTDVETEVNGLLTYDRAVVKIPFEIAAAINRLPYQPAPKVVVVVPTSVEKPQTWRYLTMQPNAEWFRAGYDDSEWQEGPAGFGTRGTPGATVRTVWDTPDIWLRREVTLEAGALPHAGLLIHHDENATVYLNGVKIADLEGYTADYETVPLGPEASAAVKPGRNVIAVHVKQTGGGQYIDLGLVNLEPAGGGTK